MRFRQLSVLVGAFCMIGTLLPTPASASEFRLRVEDLSVTGAADGYGVVITDGSALDEANPLFSTDPDGNISVTLAPLSGNVSWSLTFGISKPVLPTAPGVLGELLLTSFNMTTSGPAHVRLTLEDTGFVGASPSAPLKLTNNVTGTFCSGLFPGFTSCDGSKMTMTATSWANMNNEVPALGPDSTGVGNLLPIGNNVGTSTPAIVQSAYGDPLLPLDFTGASSASFQEYGLYSLFTQVDLYFEGAGDIRFSQDTKMLIDTEGLVGGEPTPEPASLMLISTGILGLAGARRRFRKTRG